VNERGYLDILYQLKREGYRFALFSDESTGGPCVILRHDIDFSLRDALAIAELDHSIDIRSTFFFLVRSGLYNLLSREACSILDRIGGLGHEIGLHFDASIYSPARAQDVEREKALVRWCAGTCIAIISLHRPPLGIRERNNLVASVGCATTYDDRWVNDMTYVSDSRGEWSGVPKNNKQNIQVLLHPFWWTPTADDRCAKLRSFIVDAARDRRNALVAEVMPSAEDLLSSDQ